MLIRTRLLAILAVLALPAVVPAQLSDEELAAEPPSLFDAIPEGHGIQEFDPADFEDLIPVAPEGAVAWQTLREVDYELGVDADGYDRVIYIYPPSIAALHQHTVRVLGFMLPLMDIGGQSRFLLAAYPPSCPFCLPAGPSQLIEVQAARPLEFDWDPVLLEGEFHVLQDDPTGLMYRMTDARRVGP